MLLLLLNSGMSDQACIRAAARPDPWLHQNKRSSEVSMAQPQQWLGPGK